MKKIKLSQIAIYALCFSSVTSTGHAFPRYTNPAYVGLDLTGGWFKGAVNDSGYGIAALNLIDAPPSGDFLKVSPKGEFGGAVALIYGFAASPYSIELSYWKIDTESTDVEEGNIGVTRTPATWGVDFATNVSSQVDYDNDLVRLALGATFHPDCNATIIPQLGGSYLRVRNDQATSYSGAGVPAGTTIFVDEKSVFKGIGPSFSIDVDYKIGGGFSLFGDFIYSALIGNIKSSFSASNSGIGLTTTNIDSETKEQVVSLLQTEIGLAYHFVSSSYLGALMIGYSGASQLGATENSGSFVDDISDSKYGTSITSVGFQGPFARVTFDFNV